VDVSDGDYTCVGLYGGWGNYVIVWFVGWDAVGGGRGGIIVDKGWFGCEAGEYLEGRW